MQDKNGINWNMDQVLWENRKTILLYACDPNGTNLEHGEYIKVDADGALELGYFDAPAGDITGGIFHPGITSKGNGFQNMVDGFRADVRAIIQFFAGV